MWPDENISRKYPLKVKVEDSDVDERIDRQPEREMRKLILIVRDKGSK